MVLGDLGRSPRMQYHAEALALSAADVDVIAYEGETPGSILDDRSRITIHVLTSGRARHVSHALYIPDTLLRVLAQTSQLLSLLLVHTRKPDVILVQSPPAIPVIAVALLAARVRGARLLIDWHNFGYSMLALRLGPRHPVARLARVYERTLARHAHAHLCVSHAMKRTLETEWGLRAVTVLHDRPHARFRPYGHGEWDTGRCPRRSSRLVNNPRWRPTRDHAQRLDAGRTIAPTLHEGSAH